MKVCRTLNAIAVVALLAACTFSTNAPAPEVKLRATTATSGEQLMYVGNNPTLVYVYSYPGGKLKDKLAGFAYPKSLCADTGGDVFIVDYGQAKIFEYASGGREPLDSFSDAGYAPTSCSVDPTTGNFAVVNEYANNYTSGTVAIYSRTNTHPIAVLTDPDIYSPLYCGYDAQGNLYVDGYSKTLAYEFAELPAGSTSFQSISLDVSVGSPGSVQWDGKYLAVGDSSTNVIYQIKIAGSSGTEESSTTLEGVNDAEQFWIDGGRVAADNPDYDRVGIWKYPGGGKPEKLIEQNGHTPIGVTVSSPAR